MDYYRRPPNDYSAPPPYSTVQPTSRFDDRSFPGPDFRDQQRYPSYPPYSNQHYPSYNDSQRYPDHPMVGYEDQHRYPPPAPVPPPPPPPTPYDRNAAYQRPINYYSDPYNRYNSNSDPMRPPINYYEAQQPQPLSFSFQAESYANQRFDYYSDPYGRQSYYADRRGESYNDNRNRNYSYEDYYDNYYRNYYRDYYNNTGYNRDDYYRDLDRDQRYDYRPNNRRDYRDYDRYRRNRYYDKHRNLPTDTETETDF